MMFKLYNTIREKLADNRLINKTIIAYVFVVLTYQIMHLIVPFRQAVEFLHLGFFSSMLAVIGFGIFVWDTLIDRVYLRTKFSYFLIGIIGLMLVSTFININYGLVSNAKVIIWQVIQMLVVFPLYKRVEKDTFLHSLKVYTLCVSILFAVLHIIGFVQYYGCIHYLAPYEGGFLLQGFSEGRLFGLYSSPHFASVFVLILLVISVYYAITAKTVSARVLNIVLALLHFLYAVASGTRSVIIGMSVALAVFAFLWLHNYFSAKQKLGSFVKSAVSFLLAVCVMVGTVGVFTVTEKGMKATLYAVRGSTDIEDAPLDEEELDRTDVSMENISNHRFEIWGNYFEAGSARIDTFLFGMSPGGYMSYIRENFPDMFIVEYIREKYPRMFAKSLIYDTHNAYFGAFATTGVIGLLVLLAFLAMGFVRTVRFVVKAPERSGLTYVLLTVIVFILASSFFDSDVFFKCTSTSVIFWMTTGLLLKSIDAEAIKTDAE